MEFELPGETASIKEAKAPLEEVSDEEAMLYCPVCNQRLHSRSCKLVCDRCGYFMSCADYY